MTETLGGRMSVLTYAVCLVPIIVAYITKTGFYSGDPWNRLSTV